MAENSQNTLIVARKGEGKSTYIMQLLAAHPVKKQVVYDQNDNPIYSQYPLLDELLLSRLKRGAYRIVNTDDEYIIKLLAEKAWNTVIILEDMTRYADSQLSPEVRRLLADSKQRGNHIVCVYHSFRNVPPKMMSFIDFVVVGRTGERIEQFPHLRSKFPLAVIKANNWAESQPQYTKKTVQI